MSDKKSLEERLSGDILTDNSKTDSYPQCRDCIFRGVEINGKWIEDGDRCYCKIFSKNDSDGKPDEIYRGTEDCEYYEKEE